MKILIAIIALVLVNSSFAQLSISISGGVDAKEISLYSNTAIDGDNAYWNNGISIGANIECAISERFIISALFHYSNYSFDKYANSGFMIPEISFLYAEGESSKLLRTSVEAKYFPFPKKRFKFFILSGLGILVEDLGSIKTHYSNMNGSSKQTYFINPVVKNSLVHSLGLGVRTSIISNLFFDISGSYYSDYAEIFQTFFGLNLGYQIL
jgi:hypothetical protein